MRAADMIGRTVPFVGRVESIEHVLNSELREPTPMRVRLSLVLADSQHVVRTDVVVPFLDMAAILEEADAALEAYSGDSF